MDFTKDASPEIKTNRNHEVHMVMEASTLEIPSGTMVITVDLTKPEYPLSQSGKSIAITRSNGRFETIPETTIFYNLSVSASLPKAED